MGQLERKIPVKAMYAAGLALGSALPALAHEAPIDTHTELVPIPAYNLPFGAASAAASLQAAEVFLASFDEATKAQFMFDLNAKEREGWDKLGVSFWDYLGSRLDIPGAPSILPLPDLIRQRAAA